MLTQKIEYNLTFKNTKNKTIEPIIDISKDNLSNHEKHQLKIS